MTAIAIKLLINIAILILQKTGVISKLEAYGIKAGTHVLTAVENIQFYQEYPGEMTLNTPNNINRK